MSPKTIDLPPSSITFPERCTACGEAPETQRTLEIKKGIDLILFDFQSEVEVRILVCRSCGRRRKWTGILVYAVLVAGVITTGVTGYMKLDNEGATPLSLGLFALFFAMIYFARNRLEGWLDRVLLGVSGVTFSDSGNVRLRFEEAALADEVEKMSSSRQLP